MSLYFWQLTRQHMLRRVPSSVRAARLPASTCRSRSPAMPLQRRGAEPPFPLLRRGTPSLLSGLHSPRHFVILLRVNYPRDFYFLGRFGKNSLTASGALAEEGRGADRRTGRHCTLQTLQLHSSNFLENQAKNELHQQMDPQYHNLLSVYQAFSRLSS